MYIQYKGGMAFQNLVEKEIITALVPASIVFGNDSYDIIRQ
jgi:hypothetical protein